MFVHTDLSVHSSILEQLDQYPFSGLRLDSINQNLMMIKYRTHEPYMDVNFKRIDGSDDFMSDGWMIARPETRIQIDSIRLEIVNVDSIILHFNVDSTEESHLYRFSYIDKVNMKTHRDAYYAEDGFYLFK